MKTKQTHTPGPWKIYPVGRGSNFNKKHHYALVYSNGMPGIDLISYETARATGQTDAEAHANARLIAASPDLLEFAKLVMAWADKPEVNNNTQRVQSIMGLRVAIQKAEGK